MNWGFVRPVLGKPLSLAGMYVNYDGGVTGALWDSTEIGQLNKENEVTIYQPTDDPITDDFVYRVADAWWIDEDTNMSRFRCYGPDGHPHPWPNIACNGKIPIDTQIYVPSGERTMEAHVVSSTYKSELITFGTMADSVIAPHTTLCVCWQLFPEAQYRQLRMDGVYR